MTQQTRVWRAVLRREAWGLALLITAAACSPTAPSDGRTPGELQITSVSPQVGSTVVATKLSVFGTGFVAGTTLSVGGQSVPATVLTSQFVSATLPPRPPGVLEIVITTPDGRSVRRADVFRIEADLPNDPVQVRVTGQVVNERGSPVAQSVVRLLRTLDRVAPNIVTDQEGRFDLVGAAEHRLTEFELEVTKWGYTRRTVVVDRSRTDPLVLELTGALIIRAGESIESALLPDHPMWCTFESIRCLHVVVEGSGSELIDLVLTATDGQPVGLIREETFLAPAVFPQRLTVPPTAMWIMGGHGRFALRAERRGP